MTTDKQPETSSDLDVANVDYNREAFAKSVNQTFNLRLDEAQTLPLRLVSLLESEHSSDEFDCFSLYFAPPEGQPPLPDGSYWLHNDELDDVFLHLSATLSSADTPAAYQYEAVLNLRKS